MKRTSLVLPVVLVLVLALTPMMSAYAEVQFHIEFGALVAGECFIGYGGAWPGDPGVEEPWFFGTGGGSAGISGWAEAVPLAEAVPIGEWVDWLVDTALGEVYIAERLSAKGCVSVSWIEEDEGEHWLFVELYSTVSPYASILAPDTDHFTVPLGGWYDIEPLRFRGIHVSGSEIQGMRGLALFEVWPFSFGPYIPDPIDQSIVLLFLMDEVHGITYCPIWVSETTTLIAGEGPNQSGEDIEITAAEVFESNVEIISSP